MSTSKPAFTLEDDDLSFIGEMLLVAEVTLQEMLTQVHKRYPEAALNDSLRAWLTQGDALLAKIEGR
jgi:hypothetical protein